MACCSRNGDLMWSGFMYLQSWAGATTRPCFQAKKCIVATSIRHRGLNIFRVLFVTETLTRCRVVVVTELKQLSRAHALNVLIQCWFIVNIAADRFAVKKSKPSRWSHNKATQGQDTKISLAYPRKHLQTARKVADVQNRTK